MTIQTDPQKKGHYFKLFKQVASSLLLAWLIALLTQRWFFDLYAVSNRSMLPTLQPGDTLLIDKISFGLAVTITSPPGAAMIRWKYPLHRRLQINDLIVFYSPIDNTPLVKRVTRVAPEGITVSGDNREHSLDSREFGPISETLIIGRVISTIKRAAKTEK